MIVLMTFQVDSPGTVLISTLLDILALDILGLDFLGRFHVDDAAQYKQVKAAILRRYDINEETYRQRFRTTRKKEGEAYVELAIRLQDLLKKWVAECKTVEAVLEKVTTEQLLNTMPTDLKIWVGERKPKSASEAGRLADDYLQARRRGPGVGTVTRTGQEMRKREKTGVETRQCHNCGRVGHLAHNCWRKNREITPEGGPKREKVEKGPVKCYNCGKRGHLAMQCPDNALFCDAGSGGSATRYGKVEGREVTDILLDTGCSRTMVERALVPEEKILDGEAVTVRCAHGDTVLYPLAEVVLQVDGVDVKTIAAVSNTLPVSVLLGTDVPELNCLLQSNPSSTHTRGVQEALVVMTRAQLKRRKMEEEAQAEKEEISGARPSTIEEVEERTEEDEQAVVEETDTEEAEGLVGSSFSEELFQKGKEQRQRLTRKQKRQERHRYGLVRAKDKPGSRGKGDGSLNITRGELQHLQETDETLDTVWKAVEGKTVDAAGYFKRDGLLYRCWVPRGQEEVMAVDQIVLPKKCRNTVLHIAHTIPSAGHLGKKKTAGRILKRFYWPTLFRDVADFCRSCEVCQKSTHGRGACAPMIPLPIMGGPFERIAMDIVGPLPRSRAGHRYVLVVCDYATKYPEAVPLKSIDAECIADELVKIFARMGIPKEILTDQGSNFTSQLLAEVYHLLHVKALRTSPYHPQTDGLVERFNKTLKEMLHKSAVEDGKDWDRLVPYVLFAYREVPHESTGFSPFELMYGRDVRGPLDVLREHWDSDTKGEESAVSYVLLMRERLEKMATLVQTNVAKAQRQQKCWYDKKARQRAFQPGEQALVLLPTSTSKLTAQWQGPYQIVRAVGRVNYLVDMYDKRKRKRVFHVNMLRKWHVPTSTGYFAKDADPQGSEDEVPTWDDGGSGELRVGEQLDEAQRGELEALLAEFDVVLQKYPGHTQLTEHDIVTGEALPIRLPPYRLPHAYRETVWKELKEMLAHGIITPSRSDWAAPIVLVKKKDGSLRICVDYRRLNSVSKVDAYPMPRVDELIDHLGRTQYLSTLDLTRGYWQVPVSANAQHKTAFTTPFGLFEFKRMPFGLQGAPATFQRMMDKLLDGLGDFAKAYIDDLIIFSTSWEDHLKHLRTVLQRLEEAGLTVKPMKCQFAMAECTYLGHVVGGGKVQMELSKIRAIQNFEIPKTKKEVRSFLGLTGYYRKFIPQYASIASPLTDLTRKSEPSQVQWSPECDAAFKQLRDSLCSAPVLQTPDFEKPFILQTDASQRGVGAVLSQLDENGGDHPVAFYSRKLLPREENYSTIEKECLAIKLGIQAFRVYLLGRFFTIQTDHRSLEWLTELKKTTLDLPDGASSSNPISTE